MLNAANRLGGFCFAFPDVCLTPTPYAPVPVPYPNFGLHTMAESFSTRVLICSGNALNMASTIPLTLGDQPGTAHPTFMGPVSFLTGSPKVIIEGTPAVHLQSMTMQNTFNAQGTQIVPSATHVFYGYSCEPLPSQVTLDDAHAMQAQVQGSPDVLNLEMLNDDVAVLSIRVFSSDLAARAHVMLQRLQSQNIRKLVLELRGNPGGDVFAAIDFASEFLAEGLVIATLVDADGDETVYRSYTPNPWNWPVEILVDGLTASAAEMFAGALQTHKRAILRGESTYGKATIQAFVRNAEGATYVSVARMVLPDGTDIGGRGLVVDVS